MQRARRMKHRAKCKLRQTNKQSHLQAKHRLYKGYSKSVQFRAVQTEYKTTEKHTANLRLQDGLAAQRPRKICTTKFTHNKRVYSKQKHEKIRK